MIERRPERSSDSTVATPIHCARTLDAEDELAVTKWFIMQAS
jgi:hypothetical protein